MYQGISVYDAALMLNVPGWMIYYLLDKGEIEQYGMASLSVVSVEKVKRSWDEQERVHTKSGERPAYGRMEV